MCHFPTKSNFASIHNTTKWWQHKNSKGAQGDCSVRIHVRQESLFSLLIITPKKKKIKSTGSTPFATWGDYSLWLPRSPAFFHPLRDWSKLKWVRSGSLLAEAELLHRKEGKFMGSERQHTKLCHGEGLNWDLASAGSMNKPLVPKGAKAPWYVLLSSKWFSPGYGMVFCLFFWSARFWTEVFGYLIRMPRPLLDCSTAVILTAHEQKYYTARTQTGEQHLQMSRNNVPSERTNKLTKTNFTESFAKTSGEAFLLAVQMWK